MVMVFLHGMRLQSMVRLTVILLWLFSFVYHILYMSMGESLGPVIKYFKSKSRSQQGENIHELGILGSDSHFDNVSALRNIMEKWLDTSKAVAMDRAMRQNYDNSNVLFISNGNTVSNGSILSNMSIFSHKIPLVNPKQDSSSTINTKPDSSAFDHRNLDSTSLNSSKLDSGSWNHNTDRESPPWMRFNTSYREVVILRSVVYYDDRPLVTAIPCLRLYVLYACQLNEDFWQYLRFRLVTADDNLSYDITKFSLSKTKFAVNWKINNTHYCQHLVTIALDRVTAAIVTQKQETDISSFLLVTFHKDEYRSAIERLNIVHSDQDNPVDFGVCVKPLFGKLSNDDIAFFLEWFELYSVFGVSNFYIYNTTLMPEDGNLQRVLNYYKQYRSLRVIQFGDGSFFPEYEKNYYNEFNMANLVARAAYVDCIYRNYKRVKYMILVDPDEIIVPRMHGTYKRLFEHLRNSTENFSNYASVYARMTMFFKRKPLKNELFQTLQYQNRTHVPVFLNRFGQSLRNKPFINTQICIITFQHHCIMAPAEFPLKMEIPLDLALTHHYRNTVKESMHLPEPVNNITDSFMRRHKYYLTLQAARFRLRAQRPTY